MANELFLRISPVKVESEKTVFATHRTSQALKLDCVEVPHRTSAFQKGTDRRNIGLKAVRVKFESAE